MTSPTEIPQRWRPYFERAEISSWRELSRRVDMAVGVVQGVILGTRRSTDEAIDRVAEALGVSVDVIYRLRGEPTDEPFVLPRKANRLNFQQRQAILAVIDGMLNQPEPGRFEVYRDNAGLFRFRLKAANGEVLASGQAYATRKGAHAGVAAFQRAAEGARIEVIA